MSIPGFYWLISGVLAGCSRPGARDRWSSGAPGGSPRDSRALHDELAWLCEQGIGAVLSLTETPLEAEALERHGLVSLHLPVRDFMSPDPEQLDHALAFIDWQRREGRAVVVHCLMGQGRTGTVLAAYLIRAGRSVPDALAELRGVCPQAVNTPAQERALHAFALRRDWIV